MTSRPTGSDGPRPAEEAESRHTEGAASRAIEDDELLQANAPALGPVGVSIDVLDEDHSLRLAMRRLAMDAALRETLGSNAQSLWAARHRLDAMVGGYREAIALALQTPAAAGASSTFPLHLRSTGAEHAEALVREILGSEYHLRDAD